MCFLSSPWPIMFHLWDLYARKMASEFPMGYLSGPGSVVVVVEIVVVVVVKIEVEVEVKVEVEEIVVKGKSITPPPSCKHFLPLTNQNDTQVLKRT